MYTNISPDEEENDPVKVSSEAVGLMGENVQPGLRRRRISQSDRSKELGRSVLFVATDEAALENLVEMDKKKKKTWSRQLVENYLSNFKWYFPQKDKADAPSLHKAWAFYEHITLARYLVNNEKKWLRAQPGENEEETELYPVFSTPEVNLNEWGIGVGLYFATVRIVGFIFLFLGLINIYGIHFYQSTEYSPTPLTDLSSFLLWGSAICTSREWHVCPDCNSKCNYTNTNANKNTFVDCAYDENHVFVARNLCNGAKLRPGMVNYGSWIFAMIVFTLLAVYQKAIETSYDEDLLTATDYSVVVSNPPKEATDPEEWKHFFEQWSSKQVTCCTIVLNNQKLISALVQRRRLRRKLSQMLLDKVDMDDEDKVKVAVNANVQDREENAGCISSFFDALKAPFRCCCNLFQDEAKIFNNLKKLEQEIKELQGKAYGATKVFVTFETEEGQRNALTALSVGKMDILFNKTNVAQRRFRGRVLQVTEPVEPSSVRWLDLDVPTWKKMILQIYTTILSAGFIVANAVAIDFARTRYGAARAALVMAVLNFTIPIFVRIFSSVEKLNSEGDKQNSLYFKVALFRWVNSALVIYIITPFTNIISEGDRNLLPTVAAVYLFDLTFSQALRLADLWGTLRKHIFGPRAGTQEAMNTHFSGSGVQLWERYTDFTRVIFFSFFYCGLYPAAFIICSVLMLLQYVTDKYSLMRTWARAPLIGTQLAKSSRKFFFTALVFFGIFSAHWYSRFPYDNVCDDTSYPDNYVGYYGDVHFINGTKGSLNITNGTPTKYCNQGDTNPLSLAYLSLQFGEGEWMTDEQKTVTKIYQFSSVLVFYVWAAGLFGLLAFRWIMSFIRGRYKPNGEDQEIDFSCVPDVSGYIPQLRVGFFAFPLLICDIDAIDSTLVGWKDKGKSYDFYNIIYDIPYEGMKRTRNTNVTNEEIKPYLGTQQIEIDNREASTGTDTKPMFSIVKYWPPSWVHGN